MRATHTPHSIPAFPIYSSAFLSPSQLVLGGGGGASRSGIKNKLRLYDVGDARSLELVDEYELERGEDAPMSMAVHSETKNIVCGVNSVLEKLEKGENENCRAFSFKENKINFISAQGTLPVDDPEAYQKVTVLSPDGTLLAVAGAHNLTLLKYPSMTPAAEPINTDKEIYDAAFSSSTLVIATTQNLLVYTLPGRNSSTTSPSKEKGKSKAKSKAKEKTSPLELKHTVELPESTGGPSGSSFRAAKYHPLDDKILYTVINTSPPRTRKTKTVSRQAFICKWEANSWTIEKSRKIGEKGLTCFDVSDDGRFLGFGSSDLSIGILDTQTLNPLVTILKAHDFPPTTIKFNPSSTLLVTGSPDCTVRIVNVPKLVEASSWGFILLILLALLVLVLAYLAQK